MWGMAAARLLVLLVLVTAPLVVGVDTAAACSCAREDPRTKLAQADAAFVGVLLERRQDPADPEQRAILVFRVEETVKGRLGQRVGVRTAAYGAACGIEVEVGQRTGVILGREPDGWHGNLCGMIRPAALREAAKPLPPPDGHGPAAVVVGGTFAPAIRLMALDRRFRTLAYGRGDGITSGLVLCPGGRRVLELVDKRVRRSLYVRSVPDLRVLRRVAVTEPAAAACLDADARSIAVLESRGDAGEQPVSRLLVIRGGRVRTLRRGHSTLATFGGGAAYLRDDGGIWRVDLETGAAKLVTRRSGTALAVSPDGRLLAIVDAAEAPRRSARLLLVPTSGAPARSVPIGVRGSDADLRWQDERRLVVFPSGGLARVYDISLREVGYFGWDATDSTIADGTAFGIGWGRLRVVALGGARVRTVRTFLSPQTTAVAAVPRSEQRTLSARAVGPCDGGPRA